MSLLPRFGLLALTLTAGASAGLTLAPSSAEALSCDSHHSENLDLELVGAELDGDALELDALDDVPGAWITQLTPSPEGSINLNDAPAYEHWTHFELDMEIKSTAEVAEYIETSEARTTGGGLCGGLPFVAAVPGVYLVDDSFDDAELPAGATLTLDAARESVVIEFSDAAGEHVLRYEVVDFYFPDDRQGGCSVAGSGAPGPAGMLWGLGLLALCAWRRPRSTN